MTLTGLLILGSGAFLVAVAGWTGMRQLIRGSSYMRRVLGLWSQRDFGWYWAGTSIQSLSQGAQFLILGWLVLVLTGSSTQLGLVLFLYGIPNVGLMLFAGVIADRVDRKWLLIVTQVAVGALILVLALATVTEIVAIWHIYVAAAVLGTVQALNMPARVALLADLVEERTLLDAVALVNAAVHAGRIAGPALIGGMIELWGIGPALFSTPPVT